MSVRGIWFVFASWVMAVALTSAVSSAGEVSLTWTMPTNACDGTPLNDLAGAKLYYGVSSSNYTVVIDVGLSNAYTITGLQAGETYYFNGTAYNTTGLESDFCIEAVKVAEPSLGNEPPQVNAGTDRAVSLPNSLVLDATVVDDGLPQNSTLIVTWSKVEGPGTVSFVNEHIIDTSVTFSEPGSYTLRLQATDGQYAVGDDVSVAVSSVPAPVPASPFNLRRVP